MRHPLSLATLLLLLALPLTAENQTIDFDAFVTASSRASKHRAARLIDLTRFNELSAVPGTLILDTRSRRAFERKHLRGAVHLNFADITEEALARVIGSKDRPILIYCNNNFSDDSEAFATKLPAAALNIPTYVTLYVYGFRNVYELDELLDEGDVRLEFAGSQTAS